MSAYRTPGEVEPAPAAPRRCLWWHSWELVAEPYPLVAHRCAACGEPRVLHNRGDMFSSRVALDSPMVPDELRELLTRDRRG